MTRFLKAAGQAIAVGLLWSLAAAMVALAIEASIDPYGEIVDVWVAALVYPAFAGGILFFALVRVAERRRGFTEVPLARAALWGALTGLLLPLALLALIGGLTDPHGPPPWRLLGLATGVMMLAMAIAAPVTVMFAGKIVEALRESEEWQALWK